MIHFIQSVLSLLLCTILFLSTQPTNALSIHSVSNINPSLNLDESLNLGSNQLKVCQSSTSCPDNEACIQSKCKDPCKNSCAPDAKCRVIQHRPICSCKLGTFGDPSKKCGKEQEQGHLSSPTKEVTTEIIPKDVNKDFHNLLSQITTIPTTTSTMTAILDIKKSSVPQLPPPALPPVTASCQQGSCGINANCSPGLNSPICECSPGFTGDPHSHCQVLNKVSTEKDNNRNMKDLECKEVDYCSGEPCGPLGTCMPLKISTSPCPIGRTCQCKSGYVGTPPNCFECVSKSDCPSNALLNLN